MAVSTSSLRACVAQPEPWKSYATFGKNGAWLAPRLFFFSAHGVSSRPTPVVRSAIEEDYAKRLAKLAKLPIGKDEIGYVAFASPMGALSHLPPPLPFSELRNSIDTLRLETDRQAGFHNTLAQLIRTDLETQVGAFVTRQQQHKKVYQAAIEKEHKVKQTRDQHASKAREKYESDCLRINSYTAQSTLVQGKDLEKIHLKLERAQQTVQVNENDYAQFTKVLQETMLKWEQDWKAFCDTCQDLEEERVEFMKDNMWAYANAVSTVCVSDDEVRVVYVAGAD